jgi:hypothetical protein
MATVTVRGNATSVTLIESDFDIETYLLVQHIFAEYDDAVLTEMMPRTQI